ncbi:BC1872 family protein [Paenibacillus amylolyticus]|uniref:BC1872 family protein n=1 Tax=Paenibacillus amylolyticus TaxID=1451 RepID=UPI000B81E5F0|nr:hypothetical protein [Paenibacillus amylolyticus]
MTQTAALTREQVINAEPGTDLNVMVAEHVFNWRRILGPDNDYDGPVEYGEVLIPPNMSEAHAYAMMPPRGRIPLYIFVNREWSSDMTAAWEVVEKLKVSQVTRNESGFSHSDLKYRVIIGKNQHVAYGDTAPEAICKAALLAVLDL